MDTLFKPFSKEDGFPVHQYTSVIKQYQLLVTVWNIGKDSDNV